MLVLLTNDDGVHADGLRELTRVLLNLTDWRAVVVAPDRERSASGHSISVHQPIEVKEHQSDNDRIRLYSTSGTPADCVKIALDGILGERPDLVISGINRGANLGTDVFYSGTVSAALEGALLGIPALALSVTAFENLDYETAAEFGILVARRMLSEDNWPRLLNVNVPAVRREDIAGVAITRLGTLAYSEPVHKRVDPRGRTWYWLSGTALGPEAVDDTDVSAIKRNLISITPLKLDLTDNQAIDILASKDILWEKS